MNVVTTANPSLRDAPWKGTIVGYYRGLVSCATATLYPLLLERNCRDFHDSSPHSMIYGGTLGGTIVRIGRDQCSG